MKLPKQIIALLIIVGFQALIAAGCQNTAHGVASDYHNAEDKVENATK